MDSIDTTDEIGEELKRDSTLVLNRGRKLIIPIMHREDLIGAVGVSRGEAFTGPEIADLKKQSAGLSRIIATVSIADPPALPVTRVIDPETVYGIGEDALGGAEHFRGPRDVSPRHLEVIDDDLPAVPVDHVLERRRCGGGTGHLERRGR